ncbi:MAG TPA: CARDB domain-containing protein [Acidobacteriota bacterium]|nr:CARDB domain-containing protein [Acidobacteriota bacterium]
MRGAACLLLAAVLVSGCAKKMDLVPAPDPAGAGVSTMCQMERELLLVSVINRGKDHTYSSTTVVRFGDGPEKVLPTHPVPPGGTVQVSVTLPPECLSGDGCTYTVTADGRYDIPETDEDNNVYRGSCRP